MSECRFLLGADNPCCAETNPGWPDDVDYKFCAEHRGLRCYCGKVAVRYCWAPTNNNRTGFCLTPLCETCTHCALPSLPSVKELQTIADSKWRAQTNIEYLQFVRELRGLMLEHAQNGDFSFQKKVSSTMHRTQNLDQWNGFKLEMEALGYEVELYCPDCRDLYVKVSWRN